MDQWHGQWGVQRGDLKRDLPFLKLQLEEKKSRVDKKRDKRQNGSLCFLGDL